MLEKVIFAAIKKLDPECESLTIVNDEDITVTYTDGDTYTGKLYAHESTIYIDFHRTFTIRVDLTAVM